MLYRAHLYVSTDAYFKTISCFLPGGKTIKKNTRIKEMMGLTNGNNIFGFDYTSWVCKAAGQLGIIIYSNWARSK